MSASVLAVLCALPAVLQLFGVNFSTFQTAFSPGALMLAPDQLIEAAHYVLVGSFTHSLLEWTAVCVAAIGAILCFQEYRLGADQSVPVIGVALLCAAFMDGFHTLAADRLIVVGTDLNALIPFTWALSRGLNGVVLAVGVGIFAFFPKGRFATGKRWLMPMLSLLFAITVYFALDYAVNSRALPQTLFPDSPIKRPYDIYPLMAYLVCGFLIFPRYASLRQDAFGYSLLLSIIPHIAAQLYMAFGSAQVYDSAFNVAHGLKVVAYVVPAAGLLVGYVRTYDQKQRQAEDLQKARAQALTANATKSTFLANMSHEIRTPMTAILGFADVILDGGDLTSAPPERLSAIQTIKRNGEYLLSLLDDILDLSKIEADRFELEMVRFRVLELVEDVRMLMSQRAEAKGLRLEVQYATNIPETAEADPVRLRQILLNLTGNAIKFTESGSVRLVVRYIDYPTPELCFDVVDTGIGLNEEQIARVFSPFSQADSSTSRKYGGTGLGLSISRRLCELMGGSLKADSEFGRGSTFRVKLPAGEMKNIRIITDPDSAVRERREANKPAAEGSQREGLGGVRILVAEDAPDNQKLIVHFLKRVDAEVTLAENGQIAADLALRAEADGNPFSIILMDLQMPVLDGYAATRFLRRSGYKRPIIALSAHAMTSERGRCMEAGCNDFATKPIDRPALLETIGRYVGDNSYGES